MGMFDVVAKGFRDVRNKFEGKSEITEENIDEAIQQIRMSMLEADVNFRIVKSFIKRVKEKALGEVVRVKVGKKEKKLDVSPGDHFIKICHDELEGLMGPVDTSIVFQSSRLGPTKIMMVGLQGSGKTTTTGKLAKHLIDVHEKRPLLVGADVYRPAAIEQLRVLGRQLDVPVYAKEGGDPIEVCKEAITFAEQNDCNVILFDTAGRLAVDDTLMTELEQIVEDLKEINESAARSLEEGLEETLTLHRLGVPPALRRSLRSTNIIENCFSSTKQKFCRNVKNWKNADMAMRWAGAMLQESQKRFRRLMGYRSMSVLLTALRTQEVDSISQTA